MVADHQVVGNVLIMFDIYLNELSYKSLDEINQLKNIVADILKNEEINPNKSLGYAQLHRQLKISLRKIVISLSLFLSITKNLT
jgi:hypothetical protein